MIERIGRYEVQAELGRGGFGRVYRAFDPTVSRHVAIKTLNAGGDQELLVRFRNEAASAGKLRHRNIVIIYDYGDSGGEPFIVMELLEGEDLARVIRTRRPLSVLQKMQIMGHVAEGLDHAHRNGIVHRDVKPANMMLLPDFNVKIMDFGIALVTEVVETRLTKTGMVPGTLKYMSPEQFRGEGSDSLSDIFSFGTSYYELLCGHHPFDGPTPPAIMFNIVHGEPRPLRELCPECPESLENAILRCLSKDRDSRYPTLDELLLDVKPVLIDLQQERARTLFAEAEHHVEAGNSDAAQPLLREVLALDPGNREARRLREQLQQTLQRQTAGPKVEALVNTGRQQLDARQFSDAINTFEAALKLDRSNRDVVSLLTQARTTQQRFVSAGRLVQEASGALSRRDLTGAIQLLEQALATDPAHADALRLVNEARSAMAERTLVQERRQRVESVKTESTALLNRGDITAAIQSLEELRKEAPDDSEVTVLLAGAREREAKKRQEHIERLMREVDALVDARNFDRAVEMLETGLKYYPGEPIQKRLAAVQTARAGFIRDQNVQEAVASSEADALPAVPATRPSRAKVVAAIATGALAAIAIIVAIARHDTKPVKQPVPIAKAEPTGRPEPTPTPVAMPSPTPSPSPAIAPTPSQPTPTPAKNLEATLNLRGAVPGTQVRIGSRLLGVVDSAGNLTAPAPPGNQKLNLSKDQFQSRTVERRFSAGESVTLSRDEVALTPIVKVDPQAAVAQEWERLKNSKDIAQLDAFARNNRSSPLSKMADDRIQQLRSEAVDSKNAAQETSARLEWDATDKNNLKALQDYKQRYPQGEPAARATREIDRLEQKAQADRKLAEDRLKAEQQRGEREAVLHALESFTASISKKDLAGMTTIYPSVSKDAWRQAFSRARSISMTLVPQADPQISGLNATVDCEQTTHTASGGQEVSSPARKVHVGLTKKNGAWIILRID